jgi:hypothetical protein
LVFNSYVAEAKTGIVAAYFLKCGGSRSNDGFGRREVPAIRDPAIFRPASRKKISAPVVATPAHIPASGACVNVDTIPAVPLDATMIA